jgi:multidrug efflux system membrane fusion protein
LARRGLALSAGLAAIAQAGAAPRPLALLPALISATVRPAAGGVAPRVAALTEEVLKAMFLHKLKTAAAVVVTCVGLLAAGGGLGVHLRASARPEEQPPAADKATPQAEALPAKPAAEPKRVTVRRPVRRELAPSADFEGRLEAIRTLEVRAPLSGRLERAYFPAGGDVKQGDLLFEMDSTTYRLALQKAAASLKAAEARQKVARANLQGAQQLNKQNAISSDDFDKIAVDAAAVEATYKIAQAEFECARLNLEATRVKALAAGRISRPLVDAGNLVSAGGDRGTLLATITALDPIGVVFDVDQWSYLRFRRLPPEKRAKEADGLLRIFTGEGTDPQAGKLVGFEDRVDPKTNTVRGHGVFPNPDRLLLPGMGVSVLLAFGKPRPVLLVSVNSTHTDQGRSYVLVVNKHNRIERREIKLRMQVTKPGASGFFQVVDGELWIVEEGLRPGDWVVIGGAAPLKPGDEVRPDKGE